MYNHKVNLIFVSGNTIGSNILKFFLFSKFSHTGLEIDGVVYEAKLFGGVQSINYSNFKESYKRGYFEEHIIPCTSEQRQLAKDFSISQLGKKYDRMGVLAFPFRRASWQDPDRWFCSEYNAAALVRAGIINIKQKLSRISPRDLWILITNIRIKKIIKSKI